MKTIIMTDSTCDLNDEYIKESNIHIIPVHFIIDGKEYEEIGSDTITYKEFYDKLRKGAMASTAQVTPYFFEEIFRKYTNEGYSVIYMAFSSELSGTYSNAVIAKNTILEENKNVDITVIDTKTTTCGLGVLVNAASKLQGLGKSKEEIVNWIEENKLNSNVLFTVDSLEHLKRGGRISKASANIGGVLEIKPILGLDTKGSIITMKKVRGRKKAIKVLLQDIKEKVLNSNEQTIFINHGDCIEEAEYLKALILEEITVRNIIISYIGPVIGSHTGPGTLALSYLGQERK